MLASVVLYGCSGDDEGTTVTEDDKRVIDRYFSDTGIEHTISAADVYTYVVEEDPDGDSEGDIYGIYYTLTDLSSGTELYSYQESDGAPLKMLNNANSIFPLGLEFGLDGLRAGSTYGLIFPSTLGYNIYRTSAVTPQVIPHFVVEVVSRESAAEIFDEEVTAINAYIAANELNDTDVNPIDPVDEVESGLFYKRMVAGVDISPSSGDSVTINYVGTKLDGSQFDALDGLKFEYGTTQLISGFNTGIGLMQQDERAMFIMTSSHAYGASVRVIPEEAIDDLVEQLVLPSYTARIRPFESLIFDVSIEAIE